VITWASFIGLMRAYRRWKAKQKSYNFHVEVESQF
ncbi:hypothetical protein A2U01_0090682, partial [Trifolium medium]|nr:hypothetical protein [Trifolium medium]